MLTREILKRVREIQIRTGRQAADVLAGRYVSVFKGQGVEFDEVRPYVPGDDPRRIDWNVTARMGQPYVKRYVEERQLTIMLLTDISASQDFGSAGRSKREATAELCALLAMSASANDDKVGLALFHGQIEQYIPARKGQKHALRVIREVLAHTDSQTTPHPKTRPGPLGLLRQLARPFGRRPRGGRQATNIAGAMDFLMSVNRRRCVCFVISDFMDADYDRALQMANRRHDVVAVHIHDPREQELANVGLVRLTDVETGHSHLVDTGAKATREAFADDNRRRLSDLKQRMLSSGIDLVSIDVSESIVTPLVKFFRQRERRRRSGR